MLIEFEVMGVVRHAGDCCEGLNWSDFGVHCRPNSVGDVVNSLGNPWG